MEWHLARKWSGCGGRCGCGIYLESGDVLGMELWIESHGSYR